MPRRKLWLVQQHRLIHKAHQPGSGTGLHTHHVPASWLRPLHPTFGATERARRAMIAYRHQAVGLVTPPRLAPSRGGATVPLFWLGPPPVCLPPPPSYHRGDLHDIATQHRHDVAQRLDSQRKAPRNASAWGATAASSRWLWLNKARLRAHALAKQLVCREGIRPSDVCETTAYLQRRLA
jgi:hypothetical protein